MNSEPIHAMSPNQSSKTKLFLNLCTASDEGLTSKDFLDSHIKYGLWLRPLSAWHLLKSYSETNPSPTESLAFEASLYQAYGSCIEDLTTSIIAFSLWKPECNKAISDVFNQIIIAPTENTDETGGNHLIHDLQQDVLYSNKKRRVNPSLFLNSLSRNASPEELPGIFGIDWKKHKSRNFFKSKEDQEIWKMLPEVIGDVLASLNQSEIKLIGKSHNKIKHGPQIHIISVDKDIITVKRGNQAKIAELPRTERLLQILLSGSSVGASLQDLATGRRNAPILYPGPDNLKRIFHLIMLPNILNWSFVLSFLRNQTFPEIGCSVCPADSGVLSLLSDSSKFRSTKTFDCFKSAMF